MMADHPAALPPVLLSICPSCCPSVSIATQQSVLLPFMCLAVISSSWCPSMCPDVHHVVLLSSCLSCCSSACPAVHQYILLSISPYCCPSVRPAVLPCVLPSASQSVHASELFILCQSNELAHSVVICNVVATGNDKRGVATMPPHRVESTFKKQKNLDCRRNEKRGFFGKCQCH